MKIFYFVKKMERQTTDWEKHSPSQKQRVRPAFAPAPKLTKPLYRDGDHNKGQGCTGRA
jgi:hypothetical protein